MIGNDARNDAPASALGIPVYLLDVGDAPARGAEADSSLVSSGDWAALAAWLGVTEGAACSSS